MVRVWAARMSPSMRRAEPSGCSASKWVWPAGSRKRMMRIGGDAQQRPAAANERPRQEEEPAANFRAAIQLQYVQVVDGSRGNQFFD